ncbi:PTS sugar transporter subunit IIC [Corynebacterium belfantii]|nr:PTS sugar transporter subunit IIC [Corynebacterium belfantii]MBG9242955.1 PTS sugar transporter subunit IIC [Corynebacterium belfantii]MBG9329545.1 PTS sugar transporter subunit IIC [Corynebacterium belfantii]MBG9333959.1 PTS sugar transporter subunit IIC [Corynebacterium belfantii]MBG9350701.1 PTS sugar transporter subunit IIC [Corynebacterium belfantii]
MKVLNGIFYLQGTGLWLGTILSLAFCLAIVSPISTVGIATAIYMSGVAAGTANLSRFWNFRACGTTCCAKCRGR